MRTFGRYTAPLVPVPHGPLQTALFVIWILPMTPILLWANGKLNGKKSARNDQQRAGADQRSPS